VVERRAAAVCGCDNMKVCQCRAVSDSGSVSASLAAGMASGGCGSVQLWRSDACGLGILQAALWQLWQCAVLAFSDSYGIFRRLLQCGSVQLWRMAAVAVCSYGIFRRLWQCAAWAFFRRTFGRLWPATVRGLGQPWLECGPLAADCQPQ
jgi:hypothetical protein